MYQHEKYHLHFFRHGQTDWNKERRWQGQTNIPLNDTGRTQAAALAEHLIDARVEAILSSDLDRARETAEIANRAVNVGITLDKRLREINIGHTEGMLFSEVMEKFGEDGLKHWNTLDEEHLDWGFPGGETKRQVADRAWDGVTDFIARHQSHRSIGISTHGGVILNLLGVRVPALGVTVPLPHCQLFSVVFFPLENRLEKL